MKGTSRTHQNRGGHGPLSGLAAGFAAIGLTLLRIDEAGRRNAALQQLNGATDAYLAARGLSRSGEVERIFG